jgi:hypothetical protein
MQLAPGETIASPATPRDTLAAAGPAARPQQCPLTVMSLSSGLSFGHALVDALTTSEFERQIDSAQNGGADKTYLDVRLRNDSQKAIKTFEYSAVYRKIWATGWRRARTSRKIPGRSNRVRSPGSIRWIAPNDCKPARAT